MKTLKLGTRGSALALAQADQTTALLEAAHPGLVVERVIIKTTGDRRTDVPLDQVAKVEGVWDKGVFIKELEVALETGEIDLAVHSLKDLPTILEPQFILPAVLEREDTRDVLITRNGLTFDDLGPDHTVATSSVRRAEFLKHLRPGIQICDLRGNVPTRLDKLAATVESGAFHGILLAAAGLNRLGYAISGDLEIDGQTLTAQALDPTAFFPAAGQGAIALQTRIDDSETINLVEPLNHTETNQRITAEREFLRLLSAGCHTPVGVHSEIKGEELHLSAQVFDEADLSAPPQTTQAHGPTTDPIATAHTLHKALK